MSNPFHTASVKLFNEQQNEEARLQFLQAKASYDVENFSACIVSLEKYLTLTQNAAEQACAYDLIGICHQARGEEEAALSTHLKAIEIYPQCESAWHNLGLLHMARARRMSEHCLATASQQFDMAKDFLFKALTLASDCPEFLHSMASWFEEHIDLFLKAVDADTEVIYNEFNTALQYYESAITRLGDSPSSLKTVYLENMTECYAQSGHFAYQNKDYALALERYGKALAGDSQHLQVLSQTGMTYCKLQAFETAAEYYLRAVDCATNLPDDCEEKAQEIADAWLNLASTYRQGRRFADAAKALAEAERIAPEDEWIIRERGLLQNDVSAQALVSASVSIFSVASGSTDVASQSTSCPADSSLLP